MERDGRAIPATQHLYRRHATRVNRTVLKALHIGIKTPASYGDCTLVDFMSNPARKPHYVWDSSPGSPPGFGPWGEVFGDRVIATAIQDRLLHHAVTLNIRGNSYRLKEKLKAGLVRHEGFRRLLDSAHPLVRPFYRGLACPSRRHPDPPCAWLTFGSLEGWKVGDHRGPLRSRE